VDYLAGLLVRVVLTTKEAVQRVVTGASQWALKLAAAAAPAGMLGRPGNIYF